MVASRSRLLSTTYKPGKHKSGSRESHYIHDWIRKQLGTPQLCTIDLSHRDKVYEWANISRVYKKNISDWIRLCRQCHSVFDKHRLTIEQLKKRHKDKKQLLEQCNAGIINDSHMIMNTKTDYRKKYLHISKATRRVKEMSNDIIDRPKRTRSRPHTALDRQLLHPIRLKYLESLQV